MQEVHAQSEAAEKGAFARAERERAEHERRQDEAAAAKARAAAALRAEIKSNLDAQMVEKRVAAQQARAARERALADARGVAAEYKAAQAGKAAAQARAAAEYKLSLERHILNDVARKAVPDESAVELALNAGVLAGTATSFGVTSSLVKGRHAVVAAAHTALA